MEDIYLASDEVRYNYLIQEVVKNKEICLLQAMDGMFAMLEDSTGQEYIPVWAKSDHAARYATEDWQDYTPIAMELFEFNSWMKELNDDEVKIAAFPNSPDRIIPVDALHIKRLFEDEYHRIY
jgi:hypothetical protein